MPEIKNITITPEILKLVADIDEFKGRWKVIETLAPEKLTSLRRVATIESVGSSTRIEGAKLRDAEVEKLLSGSCGAGPSPTVTRKKWPAILNCCSPRRRWVASPMRPPTRSFASGAASAPYEERVVDPARDILARRVILGEATGLKATVDSSG